MPTRYPYSRPRQLTILNDVLVIGVRGASKKYNVPVSTISMWKYKARIQGDLKYASRVGIPPRTEEVKAKAVERWLRETQYNRTTLVCSEFGVTPQTLRRWVRNALQKADEKAISNG